MDYSAALSIFFPCFTGILSGADRASSLKNPARAIPIGTLGAICISLVRIYHFHCVLNSKELRN